MVSSRWGPPAELQLERLAACRHRASSERVRGTYPCSWNASFESAFEGKGAFVALAGFLIGSFLIELRSFQEFVFLSKKVYRSYISSRGLLGVFAQSLFLIIGGVISVEMEDFGSEVSNASGLSSYEGACCRVEVYRSRSSMHEVEYDMARLRLARQNGSRARAFLPRAGRGSAPVDQAAGSTVRFGSI